jgi:hypothetical protein
MTVPSTDAELDAVAAEILRVDPEGARTAQVLRDTLDQLYDGQRTGRYRWDELFKTEKTHCGTLVEINLQREFRPAFDDGDVLDYKIAGIEVDCKYSQTLNGWMIPPEAHRHLCLVVWAEDERSKWSMGLIRVTPERLNLGSNRDAKATLNKAGRDSIIWLFREAELPANVLLQLDRPTVDAIMALPHGTRRINALFRAAVGRLVGRAAVATVGRQKDFMKRIRANGGARTALKPEGIVILGPYGSHLDIARNLGLPLPKSGESIAVRLARATSPGDGIAWIEDGYWCVAKSGDPILPAPELPSVSEADN